MSESINLEAIRNYNEQLEKYKKMRQEANVRIQVNRNLIEQKCIALSEKLGEPVTYDNIELIVAAQIAKVNAKMMEGQAVFDRIQTNLQSERMAQQITPSAFTAPPPMPTAAAVAPTAPPVPLNTSTSNWDIDAYTNDGSDCIADDMQGFGLPQPQQV